jgi:hypothetical protein
MSNSGKASETAGRKQQHQKSNILKKKNIFQNYYFLLNLNGINWKFWNFGKQKITLAFFESFKLETRECFKISKLVEVMYLTRTF